MNKENNDVDLQEIHIIKRNDGEGYTLKAKCIINGDPSTIDIPKLQQPRLNIEKRYLNESSMFTKVFFNPCIGATFTFDAAMKPEKDDLYYSITVDPKHFAEKQIKKLEEELKDIKTEAEQSIQNVLDKISELKKSL